MFDVKNFHTYPNFSDFFELDYEIFVSFIIIIFLLDLQVERRETVGNSQA